MINLEETLKFLYPQREAEQPRDIAHPNQKKTKRGKEQRVGEGAAEPKASGELETYLKGYNPCLPSLTTAHNSKNQKRPGL